METDRYKTKLCWQMRTTIVILVEYGVSNSMLRGASLLEGGREEGSTSNIQHCSQGGHPIHIIYISYTIT